MSDASEHLWWDEASAMDLGGRDFDVGWAAEIPEELVHHRLAAELDPNFNTTFDQWFDWLFERDNWCEASVLCLGIEQSCSDGILLPWDQRETRLSSAPTEAVTLLQGFYRSCPPHALAYLAHWVYWAVRSERARRCVSPHWTPRMPLAPERTELPLVTRWPQ